MKTKLKLEPHVLKRYEEVLSTYFFYNLSSDEFWETDLFTGSVISLLDGQYSGEDIVDILSLKNSDIPKAQLEEHFYKTFKFLIKKGFLSERC